MGETVPSPVDQLLPISEKLVQDVEQSLQYIIQKAIDHSLAKFPKLKQAVESKVVSDIFDKKRDETTKFIGQFLQMQKKKGPYSFCRSSYSRRDTPLGIRQIEK